MDPELDRLRSLAIMIMSAEAALDTAYLTLRENAAALLLSGEATLAQISDAAGMDQSEVLELLEDPFLVQRQFRREP